MKNKSVAYILIASFIIILFSGCSEDGTDTPLEPEINDSKIKIAAFNIQVFGKSKREKDDVMDVLARIAREFDIMLVQEIRDASETTAPYYLEKINELEGPDYDFIQSPRLGRTSSKESYTYFYNTATVDFIIGSDFVYPNTSDDFEREPYIASFQSGNFDFTLAGVHIKPDDADSEISELPDVLYYILDNNPAEKDIIIMGDMNADGSYFNEDNVDATFPDSQLYWVISNDMDTMTRTDWTYDRILMTDDTLDSEYIMNSAGVLYFDNIYGIYDQEFIEDVSDHYPVYAEFSTNVDDD